MAALLLRAARAHARLHPAAPLFRSAAAALHCSSSLCAREDFLITKPHLKASLIHGQKMAKAVREEVSVEVNKMVKDGKRAPKLVAVLATDDPASESYVSMLKLAKKCGITAQIIRQETISEEDLLELIKNLNEDDKVMDSCNSRCCYQYSKKGTCLLVILIPYMHYSLRPYYWVSQGNQRIVKCKMCARA